MGLDECPKYTPSPKISKLYGNEEAVLSHGYLSYAHNITYYKNELGLTWKETGLIIEVLTCLSHNKTIIKDKDLCPDSKTETKTKTFKRQRNSLKAKGYLETKSIREYNEGYRNLGIKYDFTGLWLKIKELVERDEDINSTTSKVNAKDNNENSSQEEQKFLEEYNEIHNELLKYKVYFDKRSDYKNFLLKHYNCRNRELSQVGIDEIKAAYKELYLKRQAQSTDPITDTVKSYMLQDAIGNLMFKPLDEEAKKDQSKPIQKQTQSNTKTNINTNTKEYKKRPSLEDTIDNKNEESKK